MLASFRKSFALLVALTAMLFAGNAQALINSTATDGTYSNKVVHTFVSGGSCTYVSYNHYELYYRKLPTDTTWTLYFSRYVPGGYYYLWAEDTGGTPGKTYDYYMEVASPSLYLWCNGYTDRGWANNPPTALSAALPGSTIGSARVCVAPSVTDPNLNQPNTTSPDTFTYSIVSQPATGTASIVSNQVCYTPPASGPTQSYNFTIKVTDKAGNTINGTASGTVTNPTPPPSLITGLTATNGTVTNAIVVSWPASSSTNSYDVYRSTISGTKGSYIGNTASTTYSDPISNASLYYYTVNPRNINGPGPNSNQDVGWANIAPTATSVNILAVIGGPQQCVTPSVTDANNPQGENYTFSILSQPTKGTASIVSNKVCYTPVASGAGGSYAFTYRVTDKGGATFNGSANVSVSGAVQNVYATQGTVYGKSIVSWTADPLATNYSIYRSTSAGVKGSLIGSVTGTGFDDTAISGITHYFYTVVANTSAGSTPDSAQAEGWGKIPSTITDLTATKGILQNKVALSWSKNPDATGYEVWRSTTSGGSTTKIATLGAMALGYYEDTTVSGMTHYYYTVKAVVGSTISQPSNEAMGYAIIATSKVTGVSATQGMLYGKSAISWTADPAAANYDIYRSTSAGAKGSIVGSNVIGTNFDDTTVFGTIHYFYTVIAKNFVGSSPDSDQAEGWGNMPGVVSNLTASQGAVTNKVRLNWTDVVDATGYEIWRTSTSGGSSTKIATLTTPASTVDDATVSGVASYFYTVKTLIGSLNSDPNIEVEGWANGAPTNASATITTTSTEESLATPPTILDPNVTAGKNESFSLSITTPPATGTLSIVDNKFVYTPPADALFSGTLTFQFSVTDNGGESVIGNGTINVVCQAPSINALTLSQNNILQASSFNANATYSLPACSTNGKIGIEVLDSGNNIVSSSPVIPTPNGQNLTYKFVNSGIVNVGTYTVRMTASSDFGSDAKAVTLNVDSVNLPILKVTPGLIVTIGEETVSATLSNPANINCSFTNDSSAAIADPGKCYVTMINPPLGMAINNADPFPSMSGTMEATGNFPITAEVQKFDGTKLIKIGEVSKTVTVSCAPAVISSLDIQALFPYEEPEFSATYKTYACNAPLSGTLTIKSGTTVIETKVFSSLEPVVDVSISQTASGLPAGYYTAEFSLTGSSGTTVKSRSFAVKNPPLPNLMVSPSSIYQSETRVDATLQPSADTSCPLTTVQSEAEADSRKCYVSLTTTLSDMSPGIDVNGLPTLSGYPGIPGDYQVQATISRWVKGIRYDSEPLVKTVKVNPLVQPTFKFTGDADIYVGVEKLNLVFAQDSGTPCALYDDLLKAQTDSAKGKRTCMVNFSEDSGLTKTLAFNQYKVTGTIKTVGPQTISYVVSRVFADGMTSVIKSGDLIVTVNDLPPPIFKLKGGYQITEGKYYVPLNQPITRATVTAGVPTNAKMKITVTDSQQSFERGDVISDSSYWLYTPNLALMEERPVTLRVAWQDYPSVYNEQVITAVGGAEINMKLAIEAPQKTPDTQNITVKVKVGKYTTAGINYSPDTMGQWRARIVAQTNTQNVKTPITEMRDMTNGEAEFQINPAGNLFMKLTAVAELVSGVDGLDTTLSSSTRYVEVVKGSPIEGTIVSKSLDGPAPKTFSLNLSMSVDNRVALKAITWEESTDAGLTWTAIEKSNTTRHNVVLQNPGRRQARAKMINKNTLVESYTTPVEVWAYSTLDEEITGPRHMAPGYTATLASELYREGKLTTDTVNEWTIEAPSGTTTATGATATITEELEGKVFITLRTRPADTRADDPSAWSVARHYLIIKTPAKPSVSAKGPRDVETGKTYHYEGSIRPSWGGMQSVHTLQSEWQLPNGTIVTGNNLDWAPSGQDLADPKPLIFRAWVEGFKDATTKETTVSFVPWQYVWPQFTVSMKQLTIQAPSDLILIVNHDRPEMNRRFEGLTYEWSFPPSVNGRRNDAFPNRALAQAVYAGEYDITVTIRDARGHQTVLTQPIVAEEAVPYSATLRVGKSNVYDRAPMTITVRPTIYGGHPLDSVIGQLWKVDGMPVDEFTNRSYMVNEITDPGNHIISYTLNSKMGETATVESQLNLVANQPPVCELTAKPNVYVVYAEAKCTDPDGKIIAYSWRVNGQPIGSTSYRISFSKTGTPQSAYVTITAMDDAKLLSTPISINVNY